MNVRHFCFSSAQPPLTPHWSCHLPTTETLTQLKGVSSGLQVCDDIGLCPRPAKMGVVKLSGTWTEVLHPCPAETSLLDQSRTPDSAFSFRRLAVRPPAGQAHVAKKCLPPAYPRRRPVRSRECFPQTAEFLRRGRRDADALVPMGSGRLGYQPVTATRVGLCGTLLARSQVLGSRRCWDTRNGRESPKPMPTTPNGLPSVVS